MIMQIKEKTLVEYADEFRINGTGITLGDIKSRIKETAENYGARCNIDVAEIVSGGWMSSRSTRYCLAITHPQYWGCYFGFCITTREYGNFTIVNIYNFGERSNEGRGDASAKDVHWNDCPWCCRRSASRRSDGCWLCDRQSCRGNCSRRCKAGWKGFCGADGG